MEEDLTRFNPMAHRMLPKDDIGLQTVARLQRELTSLAGSLPKEKKLKENLQNFLNT